MCPLILAAARDRPSLAAHRAGGRWPASGIILATRGWYWLDPAVALAIAVVVAYHAIGPIRKAICRLQSALLDADG
jgi:hypothetical protein